MQAVILAGGKGRRLHPHTQDTPKPLVPLDGQPVLSYLLKQMKKSGVTSAVLAVNHLSEQIENTFGDGSDLGLQLSYSHEPQPLSTVAPLKLIDNLNDNFIVANGDILTDLDFKKLFEYHLNEKAILTVATYHRHHLIDYGVLKSNDQNEIVSFEEKPTHSYHVSCGIYVMSKDILNYFPDNQPFGFDNLMLTLLENNERIISYPFDGYWLDIGRIDDYEQAKIDLHRFQS